LDNLSFEAEPSQSVATSSASFAESAPLRFATEPGECGQRLVLVEGPAREREVLFAEDLEPHEQHSELAPVYETVELSYTDPAVSGPDETVQFYSWNCPESDTRPSRVSQARKVARKLGASGPERFSRIPTPLLVSFERFYQGCHGQPARSDDGDGDSSSGDAFQTQISTLLNRTKRKKPSSRLLRFSISGRTCVLPA
tara:strand:+ start:6407 stop:7000 length:594 start_codon:yes stop_codon:yes gene_type:complete